NVTKIVKQKAIYKKKSIVAFGKAGTMYFPQQAKFHPLKYVLPLRKIAQNMGVQFFEHTEAKNINGTSVVTDTDTTITAKHVIVATYDPFNKPLSLFANKGMYTSSVNAGDIKKDTLADGLYLDTHNTYHYLRIDAQ